MSAYPFLSDEWMAEVRRIRQEYADVSVTPGVEIRVNQVVTEVPFGAGVIHAHLDTTGGRPLIDLGHLDEPEVTVTLDYETARGFVVDQDPQAVMAAFLSGRIMIEGDLAKLLVLLVGPAEAHQPAAEMAARIREITA